MSEHHGAYLLLLALGVILALILLIARYKVNPFIALMTMSLVLAAASGMALQTIVKSFENGVGNILGHIAIIVALGTMIGKMMAESGAADRIARTLIDAFGRKRVHWAMVVIGFIVGLPVFFEVGFVLLVPIAFNVAKRTGSSLILVGIPMVAGLSVVHGLVPPHPAAMLAVITYNADLGRTIFFAMIVGIPTAIIAGPVFARLLAPHIQLHERNPIAEQFLEQSPRADLPSFGLSVSTILLPIGLMLIGSWADSLARPTTRINDVLHMLGGADMALLVATIVSFVTLGTMRGFSREVILKFSEESLAPTATITLLVGAGGGLGRILQDSGTSQAIVDLALRAHIPILFSAWLVAALIRLATGSATVAMSMAAAIIAPLAAHASVRPELLTIATGAGSLVFSHVNDGGFWLVKEYFNMSVAQTIKSWSVCETIISVVALLLTMLVSTVV